MSHGKRIVGWILLTLSAALGLLACGDDGAYTTVRPAFTLRGEIAPVLIGRWTPRALQVTNEGDAAASIGDAEWVLSDDTELRVDPPRAASLAPGERATLTFALRAHAPGTTVLQVTLPPQGGAPLASLQVPFEKRSTDFCDDDNDCTDDVLNLTTGVCQHRERAGSCDDGSLCTTGDVCRDGRCLGEAVECDDGVACTVDVCDSEAGCTIVPQHDRCEDDVPCSDNVCTATGCEYPPSDDGTPCGEYDACVTVDICINQACVPVDIPEDAPCDDGDPCTEGDRCVANECEAGPRADLPPPTLDAFSSQWIAPDELTLVPGGWVSSAVVGDRALFQTVQVADDASMAVSTHPELSSMMPSSSIPMQHIGQLVHVQDARYVRVRATSDDFYRIEILDLADLSTPVLVDQTDVDGANGKSATVAVYEDHIYVCGGETRGLLRFNTSNLSAEPVLLGSGMCPVSATVAVLTAGDVWAHVTGSSLNLVRFSGDDVAGLASWSFAPDGSSNYGEVVGAFLSDDVLILDIEHPTKYFAHDLQADQVVYGNAPALNGRRIIGLDGATVLIEHAPGVIARGTFNDDMTSFSLDASSLVNVPVNWALADALGWTDDAPSLRILDADETRWVIRAADDQVYLVPKNGNSAWRPDQSKEITDWVTAGERIALVAHQRIKQWDSFGTMMAALPAQEVIAASKSAFIIGAAAAPYNVMGGRGALSEAGACFHQCDQPPPLRGDTLRFDIETEPPLRIENAGQDLFDNVELAVAPTAARGCLLAQASNAGHLRVVDQCEGASFSQEPPDGIGGLVTVGRIPTIHHDAAVTMRGLYGEATLIERTGDAFVETLRLDTGYTGEHTSSAALSDDWWVVSLTGTSGARLFVTARSDASEVGRWTFPARGDFSPHDAAAVLAIVDRVIFVSHFDPDGDFIIAIAEDTAAPDGLSEVARIPVPARPLALEVDDASGTFRVLTAAGVGTMSPVCLGEPLVVEP